MKMKEDTYLYGKLLCSLFNERILEFTLVECSDSTYTYTNVNELVIFQSRVNGFTDVLYYTDIISIERIDLNQLVLRGFLSEQFISKFQNSIENSQRIRVDLLERSLSVPCELTRQECESRVFHGHQFHPLSKLRWSNDIKCTKDYEPEYASRVTLECHLFPRDQIKLNGDYLSVINSIVAFDTPDLIPIPVHPLQKFKSNNTRISDTTIETFPQCNLRTMICVNNHQYDLKLPVSLQMTSCIRELSLHSAHNAPRLIPWLKHVELDTKNFLNRKMSKADFRFVFFYDIASAYYSSQIGTFIRKVPDLNKDEILMPIAFLIDGSLDENKFNLNTYLNDNELCKYLQGFIYTFVYILVNFHCALECHCQNVNLIYDKFSKKVKGIAYRDFGGILVASSMVSNLDLATDSPIIIQDNNIHDFLDHFEHDFMSQMISLKKVSSLKDFGRIIREYLNDLSGELSKNAVYVPFFERIMSKKVKMKSLLRMSMRDDKSPMYHTLPNFIFS